MKFLITAGHLGKDAGATVSDDGDCYGGSLAPTEEQWVNLQQLNGLAAAYAADQTLDVLFAVPDGRMDPLGLEDRLLIPSLPFSLRARYELANELDAILIELHNNASVGLAKGAEALCWDKYNRDGTVSGGYHLAGTILNELHTNGLKSRGVKTYQQMKADRGFGPVILRRTKNPAVITEVGFITNPKELKRLDVDMDGFNERAGALIYRAMKRFYNEKIGV